MSFLGCLFRCIRVNTALLLTLACFGGLTLCELQAASEDSASSVLGGMTRWTMINVTPKTAQADCHLLEFPDGTKVLVDPADAVDAPGTALAYLQQHQIKHLELVVISHFHLDHYGRLVDIVKAGIQIDRVAINLPADRSVADRERPWGCDWDHVQSVLQFLRERKIPYFTPIAGEVLIARVVNGVAVKLEVVCLYDGIHTPVGETMVNDTSIVLRLSHGATRALFTGDLDLRLGAWLAQSHFDLAADIIKVPHHGAEVHPPNEFYDRVNPKVALVSAPKALWLGSLRCKRLRDYFSAHSIPAYVTGLNGHVTVNMTAQGFSIQPEHSIK